MTAALSILLFGHLATMAQQAIASATPPDRVEIVLFSDFQCPFCAQIAQPMRECRRHPRVLHQRPRIFRGAIARPVETTRPGRTAACASGGRDLGRPVE